MIEAVITAVLLFIALVFSVRRCKKLRAEIKSLKSEVEAQKRNTAYIFKHASELARIDGDRIKIEKEIHDAKNDEEIISVINALASANNGRVRDDKPAGADTAAKA